MRTSRNRVVRSGLLALILALAAICWIDGVVLADVPQIPATVDVRDMDDLAATAGAWMAPYVAGVESEWTRSWGWHPSRPTSVNLYFDGVRMADDLALFRGSPLSETDQRELVGNLQGYLTPNLQTGGWTILLDLSKGYGNADWQANLKWQVVRAYTDLMVREVAPNGGPEWFRQGFVDDIAFRNAPTALFGTRALLIKRQRDTGTLMSLRRLIIDWSPTVRTQVDVRDRSYAMADLAVHYLADRVGGAPLLQILVRTGNGESFDAVLYAATGYTIDRLNLEYAPVILPTGWQP